MCPKLWHFRALTMNCMKRVCYWQSGCQLKTLPRNHQHQVNLLVVKLDQNSHGQKPQHAQHQWGMLLPAPSVGYGQGSTRVLVCPCQGSPLSISGPSSPEVLFWSDSLLTKDSTKCQQHTGWETGKESILCIKNSFTFQKRSNSTVQVVKWHFL